VLVAVATGTALAIRPDAHAPVPQPASPSTIVSVPPVEVSPTSEPSASASTTASNSPTTPASVLPGTRFYLETTSSRVRIHAVRDGSDRVVHQLPITLSYGCEAATLTVSPDGKRVAWVQDTTDGNFSGVLLGATLGKKGATKLLEDVSCLGPRALVWRGDDLLMVQKKSGQSVLYDLAANQRVDGDPGQETDRCWSADGKWLAAVSEGKPYVTDETQSRQYAYTPPKDEAAHWGGWQARSVSLDGRYVSIGWVGTDPSRHDDSFVVVDTTTSKVVDLPVKGEIRSITFTVDNKVIVKRANSITVLDTNFTSLGTVTETATVRNMWLLAYVP
jgi:Tol biopolymer transport system component